jgi:hypothetical protein
MARAHNFREFRRRIRGHCHRAEFSQFPLDHGIGDRRVEFVVERLASSSHA